MQADVSAGLESMRKQRQGVIWGKESSYFKGACFRTLRLRVLHVCAVLSSTRGCVVFSSSFPAHLPCITHCNLPADHKDVIAGIASEYPLHTTLRPTMARDILPPGVTDGVEFHGHMPHAEWLQLLVQSKFLLGLGDPLAGACCGCVDV